MNELIINNMSYLIMLLLLFPEYYLQTVVLEGINKNIGDNKVLYGELL